MIIVSGQMYSTIVDAARELKVSAKTIRHYIAIKIIPEPPVIQFGNRLVWYFPKNYLAAAKEQLQRYRTGSDSQG